MLELEEALGRILAVIPTAVSERVPLAEARGRFLIDRAFSLTDLPPFDNSAMDGYAVRSQDVLAAKPESPVRLRLAGRVAAGEMFAGNVAPGSCVRLFTGSPLPLDADAVVMQEDTKGSGSPGEEILVLAPTTPWENTRLRGEDIRQGTPIAEAGSPLGVGLISLLAAAGCAQVNVGVRPVVALLATGSELREPGVALEPGQIYESNRLGLAALARAAGGIPRILPLVPDQLEATRLALMEAFEQCDVVVTSGGVSVGEMDFVKRAFEDNGGEMQFWKVAIKPGRPFVFGRWRGKFLFGLPGNPVSALVTFLLLVRPALLRWQGAADLNLPRRPGILGEPLANRGERRHLMRVKVDASGNTFSAGLQASHILSSMATANGLVDVPPQTTLPSGTAVQVLRWD